MLSLPVPLPPSPRGCAAIDFGEFLALYKRLLVQGKSVVREAAPPTTEGMDAWLPRDTCA